MHDYLPILAIIGALVAGAISPGPSFLFVARNSIALSRRHGFATALGMGCGACLFALMALLGLHAVLTAVPLAFWVLKIAGGLYLLWLAFGMLRAAKKPLAQIALPESGTTSLGQAFLFGLLTQLSNPKTAIVFAGIFSALLPRQIPPYFYGVSPLAAFCIDTLGYAVVAFLLSAESPRKTYLRFKAGFDSGAAGVMALLGLKLLFSDK